MNREKELEHEWNHYVRAFLASGDNGLIGQLQEELEQDESDSADKYRRGFLIAWRRLGDLGLQIGDVCKFMIIAYLRSMKPEDREHFMSDENRSGEYVDFY